jgi:predicted transcriptional regulator
MYPLAVLAGGIFLVGGVRWLGFPSAIALPGAAAIATAGAAILKGREPESLGLDNANLERELLNARQRAHQLVVQADELQAESVKLLTSPDQVELLGIVQYACDHSRELPKKLDELAKRLSRKGAILSVEDLEGQLKEAQQKQRLSTGLAQEQWGKLVHSLNRNIELARQGEDAREAQVVNLSTLIVDAGGTLQQLQNKLRSADLNSSSQTDELRELGLELNNMQESIDLLLKAS